MKKVFLSFLTLIMFSGYVLQAQDATILLIDNFKYYKRVHSTGVSPSLTYDNVEGSPYLYPEYRDARVFMKGGIIYEGTLKYDLYAGEMEYENDGQTYWIDNMEQIDHIVLDGDTFVYLTPEGQKKGSWFQLLADGPFRLLAGYHISYSEPQSPRPYQDAKPAKFTRRPDTYFLQKNENPPVEISSKKTVIDFFKDQKAEITNYIKKNHLNVRKEDDLLTLVHYVNMQ